MRSKGGVGSAENVLLIATPDLLGFLFPQCPASFLGLSSFHPFSDLENRYADSDQDQ
jgi:hypothetical protein